MFIRVRVITGAQCQECDLANQNFLASLAPLRKVLAAPFCDPT